MILRSICDADLVGYTVLIWLVEGDKNLSTAARSAIDRINPDSHPTQPFDLPSWISPTHRKIRRSPQPLITDPHPPANPTPPTETQL